MSKKEVVPEKLQRFLMTTARRENIGETMVGAVIIRKGRLLTNNENSIPTIAVVEWNIGDAVDRLAQELQLVEYEASYLGYHDIKQNEEVVRLYNFMMDAPRIRLRYPMRMARFRDLGRAETSIVLAALRKREKLTLISQKHVNEYKMQTSS